ncbi:MAG: LytTR family transcriptional regulator [Oscillospiraceae bacterium]|nr:LytTR family transcriptional regulator [Oscillospiraceae bacterium]
MKCEIIVDPTGEERVVVYTRRENDLTRAICQLAEEHTTRLVGYRNGEIVPLTPARITCITVEGDRVFALCRKEKLQMKQRLYVLEELLGNGFVKINQSCLANVSEVERFDASMSGTLKVKFKNGYVDYVSRRQMKTVKERFGIK